MNQLFDGTKCLLRDVGSRPRREKAIRPSVHVAARCTRTVNASISILRSCRTRISTLAPVCVQREKIIWRAGLDNGPTRRPARYRVRGAKISVHSGASLHLCLLKLCRHVHGNLRLIFSYPLSPISSRGAHTRHHAVGLAHDPSIP